MKRVEFYTVVAIVALLVGLWLFHKRSRQVEPLPSVSSPAGKTGGIPSVLPAGEAVATTPLSPAVRSAPTLGEEISAFIAAESPAGQKRALDRLFQRWTVLEAPAAADFALQILDADARRESMLRVMRTWAVQDADAALFWAKTAPFETSYERQVAMSMACTQVSFSDPEEAVRLALKYEPDRHATGLLEGLTARWAEKDMQAAQTWAISQPAGSQRDALMESIALVLFETAPAKAVNLAVTEISDAGKKEQAVLTLLGKLAGRDPELAQGWIDSFSEGAFRERAKEHLAAWVAAPDLFDAP